MPNSTGRRTLLKRLSDEASVCERCQLSSGRSNVVFGTGDPSASVMFVGEAPGAAEDRDGVPFVGRSGRLLDELLAEVGIDRREVYITNVVKCRPPGNRDPQAVEIENCSPWLRGEVEMVEPRVVCPLGNFATKLLRGEPTGITVAHGRQERRPIGGREVILFPLFHPAAALRSRMTLSLLRDDLAVLAGLIAESAG